MEEKASQLGSPFQGMALSLSTENRVEVSGLSQRFHFSM